MNPRIVQDMVYLWESSFDILDACLGDTVWHQIDHPIPQTTDNLDQVRMLVHQALWEDPMGKV
jgi:hypothetical protein